MSKVIIEVNGVELDLAKDIGFGLNYSVDDVKNPEKRNGNYSKTITLAGSKNNNKVLGGLFDINADFTFFNPNIKTSAKIIVDSSTVMNGYLRLNSIDILKDTYLAGNLISYQCTVFSQSTDFFSTIKDKKLSDLDFNRYSHEYTYLNISNSWVNDSTKVYTYPLPYNGRADNTYVTQDFKPSIFYRAYLKRIAQEAGYTLSGSLLDINTSEGLALSKEIIPFSGETPLIPQVEYDRRKFQAGMAAVTTVINNGTIEPSFLEITNADFIDNDSTGGNFDNGNVFNTSTSEYTVDRNGSYDFNINVEGSLELSTDSIEAFQSEYDLNFQSNNYTEVNNNTNNSKVSVSYRALKNGVGFYSSDNVNVDLPIATAGNSSFNLANNYENIVSISHSLNLPNIYLNENDIITVQATVSRFRVGGMDEQYTTTEQDLSSFGSRVDVPVFWVLTADQTGTFFKNDVNASALTDGDTIHLNEYIPKELKQSDLITDLIKRYNAYISVNPENENDIIIETRDTYYDRGEVLDWTNKKDYSKKDSIKLLSELQNKEFNFTYKKSETEFNKKYTDSVSGDLYGVKKIEFNNEFVKGIKKIETPFTATPLIYNSDNPVAIVPEVYSVDGKKNEAGVIYYGGLIDTLSGYWKFQHVTGGVTTTNNHTAYPYAGHFDNPINPTIDLNFGESPFLFYNELESRTNSNLYNRFWSNYINQLDNGKFITSSFNLNEVDIAYIRNNLNAKIWIKDSYFRISKIKDFNPINKTLTKVDLIKIEDGISFVQSETSTIELLQPSFRVSSIPVENNNNIDKGFDSLIAGQNNGVGADSLNTLITGSNNSVSNNINNAFIIGSDNKEITKQGQSWLGEEEFIDGELVNRLKNRIIVNQSNYKETLGGLIDSTKEYFIDGLVNLYETEITVPSTGINLKGYNFDLSGLFSSEDNYIMFKSSGEVGSGDFLAQDLFVTASGVNSKIYNLTDGNGFHAHEIIRLNYNDCTSIGTLTGYRQGLETGTGRFGGSPSLTLGGSWLGGYRISTSIVRSLSASMTEPLFKKGVLFTMQSRFITDINVDLPVSAALTDFDNSNFPNPSSLQFNGCAVTRNGVINSEDTNLTPNTTEKSLSSNWDNNRGLRNTFIGGINTVNTEVITSISSVNTKTLILGSWTGADLQHFTNNFNYSLQLNGTDPSDFRVSFDFVLQGTQDEQYKITLIRDRGGVTSEIFNQTRTIDRLAGSRDVTYFNGTFGIKLIKDDFIYWEVENLSSNSNCTLVLDSQFIVEER